MRSAGRVRLLTITPTRGHGAPGCHSTFAAIRGGWLHDFDTIRMARRGSRAPVRPTLDGGAGLMTVRTMGAVRIAVSGPRSRVRVDVLR